MTDETRVDLLRRLTTQVLEEAAFIFTEEVSQPPPFDGDVIEATMRFSGHCRGTLHLRTSAPLGTVLAANLLGLEPDDPDAVRQSLDAVGETLNVIGGAICHELSGPETIGQLGIPVVQTRPADDEEPARSELCVHLLSEDGQRIDAAMVLEG